MRLAPRSTPPRCTHRAQEIAGLAATGGPYVGGDDGRPEIEAARPRTERLDIYGVLVPDLDRPAADGDGATVSVGVG